MTEPNDRQRAIDETPTTPMQQAPLAPHDQATGLAPTPPYSAQNTPPTAWQPVGWTGAQETEPIVWTPAGQLPVAAKSRSRGRWVVALLGALVILIAAVGVAVFAVGSKSNAAVGPTFLPATTPLYMEARLDLPGAQRDNVIKLLAHFPGFADPSSFDQKVNEAFDKLVKSMTSDKVSYTTDVKPWFGGQIAVGMLEVPASLGSGLLTGGAASSSAAATVAADAAKTHLVAGVSIKDRSRLDTLIITVRALLTSVTFSPEQYGDHTLVTATRDGSVIAAYSLSDTLLLIAADPADLKTSLDVVDGKTPSLARDAGFISAMKDLPTERLGAVYAGSGLYQAMAGGMTKVQDMLGGTNAAALTAVHCIAPAAADPSKEATAAAIVANGTSVAIQSRSTGLPAMGVKTATDLAAHMPAGAMLYAEFAKVGGSLHDIVACLRTAMPDAFAGTQVKQIEKTLGTSLEDYLSFVTDLGVSVSYDGTKFHWGLVATVDNEDTAKSRVNTLLSFAKLAGGLGQAPVTVTDQQVSGTTVSTVTLTDTAGMGNLPVDPSISVAVAAGHFYLGGGDFAATAVARTAADSLASDSRYSSALAGAGNPNGILLYLDVDALRQRIEAAGASKPDYVTNTQPYLKPFDRLIIGSNQDGDAATGRVMVFVK